MTEGRVIVQKQDPARAISDELRGRHGIESRAGVEDTERVDYFRQVQQAIWTWR